MSKLCKTCREKCKQPDGVEIHYCPDYVWVNPAKVGLKRGKRPKKDDNDK